MSSSLKVIARFKFFSTDKQTSQKLDSPKTLFQGANFIYLKVIQTVYNNGNFK